MFDFIPSKVKATRRIVYEILQGVLGTDSSGREVVGNFRSSTRQIILVPKRKKYDLIKDLIHEMVHMIDFHYIKDPSKRLTEDQTIAMEKGIFNVLRVNGWLRILMKVLREKAKGQNL